MSTQLITEMNLRFRNRLVNVTGTHVHYQGIYIGSWRNNHYSIIVFSHQEKTAYIKHVYTPDVQSIELAREMSDTERIQVFEYLSGIVKEKLKLKPIENRALCPA